MRVRACVRARVRECALTPIRILTLTRTLIPTQPLDPLFTLILTLTLILAPTNTPLLHVILPPWYDAVVALPSGKQVNGVLEPVE